MRKNLLLSFLSLFLIGSLIHSQTHTPRTVNINANCAGFYEYLPVNYASSNGKFPLMIYCGGAGTFGTGTTSQLAKLLAEGPPYYINNNQFPQTLTVNGVTTSYIVISPQFKAWGSPQDVEDVINYVLTHNYKVDISRVYLTGFSAGGDVTWKYANSGLARSKRLAALVPVSGFNSPYVDTGAKYIAAANLPVWALHSNSDQTAPVAWSQNFVNKVNSFSPPIRAKITRFDGVAHDPTKLYVYTPTFRDGGFNIYEWLLLYRRSYPPLAAAGSDISITLPQTSVSLNGSGTDPEEGPLVYSWSKVSGPSRFNFSSPNSPTTTVSNLVAGVYNFELRVGDSDSLYTRDTMKLTVINPNPNVLPQANPGVNQSISLPEDFVTLDGTGSSDADGIVETYSWSKISGPAQFTIVNSSSSITRVNNLRPGMYRFKLVVTDNEGGTDSKTVDVTVINPFPNIPPVCRAGNDQTIALPANSVTVDGSASSDADGVIVNYSWNQIAGPSTSTVGNPNAVSTTISNLTQGVYKFELAITDDSTAVTKDTVIISVLPPPALLFIKVNLYGGTSPYNLDGWNNWNVTGSSNITSGAFNYSGGTSSAVSAVLSYSQGVSDNGTSYGGTMCPPEVLRFTTYTTAASRTLTLRGLNNSLKYDIEFYASRATTGNSTQFVINGVSKSVVTDNNKTVKVVFTDLSPSNGQIVITTNKTGTYGYLNGFILTEKTASSLTNTPPVARAGNDVSLTLPEDSTQLNGTSSFDTDGNIAQYLWSLAEGRTQFNINNAAAASPKISGLVVGVYKFELKVTDNSGAIAKDTVEITVNPAGPQAPVAAAGTDRIIHLPDNSLQLNGTASSDIDGNITSYLWNLVSGPASFVIDNNAISNPTISDLKAGVYVMELIVTDNDGLIDKDTVSVMVNQPPLADAGSDVSITLPVNSIQLNGSKSSDADGSVSSYFWTKLTGPSQFNISNRSVSNPIISNLAAGTYTFELLVTDNNGGTNKDNVDVVVNKAPNVPPVANAGNDSTIVLPSNSANLKGAGSTDDGAIVSYAWSQVSGPSVASIANNNLANTTVSNLVEGVYSFELVVTDDSSTVDNDIVVITVNPAPLITTRLVKVNVYGGTNPYNLEGWNNWNATGSTNITSGTFNYDNGTATGISAVLSYAQGIADNGATYGGTMCPPQVLRYGSYSTSTRSLTIRGLNNALQYDLEFYASRASTGNSTQLTINGVNKTVVTDNNKANKIIYTDITPVNGQIVVTLARVGTYNYLNGFMLTEKAPNQPVTQRGGVNVLNASDKEPQNENGLSVSPNPFRSKIQLAFTSAAKGKLLVSVIDITGKTIKQIEFMKTSGQFFSEISLQGIPAGVYFLRAELNQKLYMQKLVKIN